MEVRHLGMWSVGTLGWIEVGFGDVGGLLQPSRFSNSLIQEATVKLITAQRKPSPEGFIKLNSGKLYLFSSNLHFCRQREISCCSEIPRASSFGEVLEHSLSGGIFAELTQRICACNEQTEEAFSTGWGTSRFLEMINGEFSWLPSEAAFQWNPQCKLTSVQH